jgi:hypothetical protein
MRIAFVASGAVLPRRNEQGGHYSRPPFAYPGDANQTRERTEMDDATRREFDAQGAAALAVETLLIELTGKIRRMA